MKHLVLITIVAFLCSCTSTNEPKDRARGETGTDGKGTEELQPAAAQGKAGLRNKAVLGQGTTSVFGLELLPGMKPAPGPNKVYRFEGVYPVEQLSDQVRQQTLCNKETKEAAGYLFRDAVVTAGSGSGPKPRLGIRVSKKPGGGSWLDVWMEQGSIASATDGKARTPFSARSGQRSITYPSGSSSSRKNMSKRQEKALLETLRVMRKLQRGEKLDEHEKKSSFFQ